MDPDTCLVIAEGDERNVGQVDIYFFVKSANIKLDSYKNLTKHLYVKNQMCCTAHPQEICLRSIDR